ncbi:MAG TPA: helix-turn-helix domain-containing GNAT family N-acetyltransferase [Candidatus Krumholzibacteria bacterium]|nr:helix-turn-helix domain-containing GNAT family N-acetyltransferase [Candidatus Krumholzibacteria bacterium]
MTRAIGALGNRYLGRPRALAASRLVFEIGEEGAELRSLRERLGLDSGYLSRLLRSLERDALVSVEKSQRDKRVRRAVLTPKGRAELKILNRLSDEAAEELLHDLPPSKRKQLLQSMQMVDRLLMSRAIEISEVSVKDARAQAAMRAYFVELERRFGFDPGGERAGAEYAPPTGLFLLASLYGETIGCGALRYYEGYAEVKRMWVDSSFRGIGTGWRILERLEELARRAGRETVRLDTNGCLHEAQALYARAGYSPIPRYNDNPYAEQWYEKHLPQ